MPENAELPGFGPKDNMWKSAWVIHPAVDMFSLWVIFGFRALDSCLTGVHTLHKFWLFLFASAQNERAVSEDARGFAHHPQPVEKDAVDMRKCAVWRFWGNQCAGYPLLVHMKGTEAECLYNCA